MYSAIGQSFVSCPIQVHIIFMELYSYIVAIDNQNNKEHEACLPIFSDHLSIEFDRECLLFKGGYVYAQNRIQVRMLALLKHRFHTGVI